MKFIANPQYTPYKDILRDFLLNFDISGVMFCDGKRNKIKLFEFENTIVNVKSFKVPNLINRIVYKFVRKSKAERSFEYANRLIELGIGTPQPIAFAEKYTSLGLGRSFYVCEHLKVDLTFRELVEIDNYPDYNNILRQFMQFCFLLHEKGIEFLDHSPGNTLIKKVGEGKYDFFLVDLNRMNFHSEMDFESRMKNLSHLTPRMDMVAQMSAEYAKLYTIEKEEKIFEQMWFYTNDFQRKFHRKISLKKKLRFWK
jgi:hypothetical protein